MSDKDISQMEVKEIRKEVQELRDAFAIMQRKYEDLFYNLDNENFSSTFIKEKNDMKAELKITAEEVSSKVSSKDVESMITQTAGSIMAEVNRVDGNVSSLNLDNESIRLEVAGLNGQYSELKVKVDSIESNVGNGSGDYSSIQQTISGIVTKVQRKDIGSIFLQDADGFIFHGDRVIISSDYSEVDSPYADFPLGDSFVKMDGSNFCLYVRSNKNGERKKYYKKIGLGFYSAGYDYPYITLGAGNDEAGSGIGCVYKLENGLWIGDASICNIGGKYPGGKTSAEDISGTYTAGNGYQYSCPNATGIFIDLVNGIIYKYEKGYPIEL